MMVKYIKHVKTNSIRSDNIFYITNYKIKITKIRTDKNNRYTFFIRKLFSKTIKPKHYYNYSLLNIEKLDTKQVLNYFYNVMKKTRIKIIQKFYVNKRVSSLGLYNTLSE